MMCRTGVVTVVALLMGVGAAWAQNPPPAVPASPVNIVVPNYNGVAAGQIASLEANAFLARANDSSSAYFNPAGLARASQTSVSGSAGVFQIASVRPDGLNSEGGSMQQIPSLVGLVVPKLFGRQRWAGGFSLTRVNAWNQSMNAQRQLTVGATDERLEYFSTSGVSGIQANLGVGYTNGRKLRVGGSIDFQLTDMDRSQSVSDQYRTATGLSALSVQSHGSSWITHLRLTAGVQYDLASSVRVGVLVRTPGLSLFQSASYVFESLAKVGAVTSTASFFDTEAELEYRLPLELKAGVAWVGTRAQFEFDILSHAAAGQYSAFRSDQTWTLVTDQGLGGAPTVQRPVASPPIVDSRSVTNVAVGGQFRLTSSGAWTLHGGYATDRSPVGPADTVFTRVNMQVVTVGLSGRAKFVLGSFAVRYETGTTADLVLGELQDGRQLSTRLKVSNLGLVYSIALLF